MLNGCIFMGRLTKDPETRYTQGAEPLAMVRFSLAVDRNFKKDGEKATDFIEVEAWRQRAEFAGKYLKKGQLICIEGSLQQYHWEDKDKNKRQGYRLVADNIYFAEGKKQDTDNIQAGRTSGNRNAGSFKAATAPLDFDPFTGGSDVSFDPFDSDDMIFNISEPEDPTPF